MSTAESPVELSFCAHCGRAESVADFGGAGGDADSEHERCRIRLKMEPPRYCRACGRRMKVQVTPVGWSAECSRHGGSHS